MQHPKTPQRFIIKVSVQNIPGEPNARPFSLYEIFSKKVLERPARLEVSVDGFDAIHIPPDFDTGDDATRWFIFDTEVRERVPRQEIHKIPLKVYLGHLDNNKELVFTPRNTQGKHDKYVKYFSMYTWGAGQLGEGEK